MSNIQPAESGSFEPALTGKTFQVEKEDLGLIKEHKEEVKIDSEFPMIITERTYTTSEGKSIRNISIQHELIGLLSDYYLYNDLGAQSVSLKKR